MSPLRPAAASAASCSLILLAMALGLRPEERVELLVGEGVSEYEQVLVAAAGDIDDDHLVFAQPRSQLDDVSDRMRRLQRRQDALGPGQQVNCPDHRVIARGGEADTALVLKPGQFGTDTGVV